MSFRLRRQSANSLVQHQFAYPEYTELRNQSAALMDIAAYGYTPVDMGAGMASERTLGAIVSGNYFDVLGVSPVLGRTFLPEENQTPGAHPVAVISDRWWKRQFHSDAAAIGRVLKVNGRAFIVIGIAPPGFTGTVVGSAPDVWLPTMMWAGIEQLPAALRKIHFDPLRSNGHSWLSLAGRLKPGVGIQAARASLNPIDLRLIETARLSAGDHGSMVRRLAVLFAVVGVLWRGHSPETTPPQLLEVAGVTICSPSCLARWTMNRTCWSR